MYELEETVGLMFSPDFKDRLKAEYWQLALRYDKLRFELIKYEAGVESKITADKAAIRNEQARIMDQYLQVLEEIAKVEGINLHES